MKPLKHIIILSIPAMLIFNACGDPKPGGDAQAAAPAQTFKVLEISPRSATLYLTFPAVLQGKQNVEIRPKIDGFIEGIYIDEGSVVKKGQKLFKISAPVYEQQLINAAAMVTSAEADINSAELQVNKTRPLVDKGIISHYELEFAVNALKTKKAALSQARASLNNARTNVGYTHIVSPVNGIASAVPYKIGSLVNSTTPEPLTTISNNGNIYAYVSLNEKQLLNFTRTYPGNGMADKLKSLPPVSLILSDGTVYPQQGRVETVNGLINTETGSASFRAIFSNPAGTIRSGGSATIKVPQSLKNALLVPQKSTFEVQGKHFLYTVRADGSVKSNEIQIAQLTTGQLFVVTGGLLPGDRVVLEGMEYLKEGIKVKPEIVPSEKVYQELN